MVRTIAIGDVHSCRKELEALLAKLCVNPESDHLVFLGDLIDRGPDPKGVVDLVRALPGKVTVVCGNHDEKAFKWFERLERQKAKGVSAKAHPDPERLAEWESLGPDNIKWLANLPVLVEPIPGWFAVHAGFENSAWWRQHPDKLMRVRYVDPVRGQMLPFEEGSIKQPEGSILWSEAWEGTQNVVYGHSVLSMTDPHVVQSPGGAECWGIDTGCVFGGRLTALCLETREVTQVQGKKYAELAV